MIGLNSRWAQLTIAGFTLGGSYFVVKGLAVTDQWWLLVPLIVFVTSTVILAECKTNFWKAAGLLVQFLLCVLMTFFIYPHAAMLFVVICLLAIELCPKRIAKIWVSICVLAVFCSELVGPAHVVSLQDAVINSLIALFLSGFAFLRQEAEAGRKQLRKLNHELEQKNRQLALYAESREQQLRMEERQRLSRELHDTLGHKLTATIVQLEAAEKFVDKDPDRVKPILITSKNLLREGLEETRNIVQLLDRSDFAKQPLDALIKPLVKDFEVATGLQVALELDADNCKIPENIKVHLLRIVQESLTNITRHAQATECHIKISTHDCIELLVQDNGVSIGKKTELHLPELKSIESRVHELSGTMQFYREEAITTLLVKIPVSLSGGVNGH